MENATDAVIMAASILLLIIALSVSIYSFTTVKSQVQEITSTEEQLQYATAGGSYLNYIQEDEDVRTVGTDAIISALRRLRKESFTIYIVGDFDSTLTGEYKQFEKLRVKLTKAQKYKNKQGNTIPIPGLVANTSVLKLSMADQALIFYDNTKQKLNDKLVYLIYDKTKGKKYTEYIGVYKEATAPGVSDVNKGRENKIITFVKQ